MNNSKEVLHKLRSISIKKYLTAEDQEVKQVSGKMESVHSQIFEFNYSYIYSIKEKRILALSEINYMFMILFHQKCTTMQDMLSLEPLISACLIKTLTLASAPFSYYMSETAS